MSADLHAEHNRVYRDEVRHVARLLREAADEVERRGLDVTVNIRDLRPDYGRAAADVVHAVTWSVANASLDDVVRAAADADRTAVEVD